MKPRTINKKLMPAPKRSRFPASSPSAPSTVKSSSLPSLSFVTSLVPPSVSSVYSVVKSSSSLPSLPSVKYPSSLSTASRLGLRPYQRAAFDDRTNGIEVWLWGRQTGKSHTLAVWAIDRLVTRPGRLVTILSNSLANGMELNQKCAEIARLYTYEFAQDGIRTAQFETLNVEIRLTIPSEAGEKVSRIKILPANPRTARGFSGDLILDEFAFHENGTAIWEAAEPILSANPDYLCRIASTPNGRHNMFYRLATDPRIPSRIVPRSLAWEQGLIIAHPITREPITPTEARALAVDKRAYDQNYECIFEAENMSLLTRDLISQAEDPSVGVICDDQWSDAALAIISGKPVVPDNSEFKIHNSKSVQGGGTQPQSGSSLNRTDLGVASTSPILISWPSSASVSDKSKFRIQNSEFSNDGGENVHVSPNFAAHSEFDIRTSHLPPGGGTSSTSPTDSLASSNQQSELINQKSSPSAISAPSASSALNPPSSIRNFYIGVDVGRNHDLTVISVLEKTSDRVLVRAILRLRNVRLPQQQQFLEVACRSPRFAAAQIDMTGLGLGLFEYTHQRFGDRIRGLNFASTIPLPGFSSRPFSSIENRKSKIGNAPAPQVLALGLVDLYESRRIKHPVDTQLREDLRKPERITTADGRVSITASRDQNGHADHFWSLALALDAAMRSPAPQIYIPRLRNRMRIPRNKFV